MCWNSAVSLNTFAFSSFVLGMVIYNNYYTQYKIPELNNIYMYLLLFSVISMQLFEFFIWRNIDNKKYNHMFSLGSSFLLLLQPFFSIMLVSNIDVRNIVLTGYFLIAVPCFIYHCTGKYLYSVVSKSGHLHWKIIDIEKKDNIRIINWSIWLFFFLFSFVYNGYILGFIFLIVILGITVYNYYQENAIGSMWCWLANSISIYYAFYLLIYLPFCDKKTIC